MNKVLISSLVFFLFLMGCGKTPVEEIGYGKFNENTYINSYFKMKMEYPSDWHVQNREALDAQTELGNQLVSGENKSLKRTLDLSKKQSLSLFSIYEHEVGSAVDFNSNITCAAEKMGHMPGVKRGKDYFFHMKKLLQSSQLKVTFSEETETVDISGVSFDTIDSEMDLGVMKVRQTYYAARMKDYVLMFALSYINDDQKKVLQDIMNKINFK